MTAADWRTIDDALWVAAANAEPGRAEDRIITARGRLERFRRSAADAATVSATVAVVRDARRIWGSEPWVLDEIEDALTSARPLDFAAARDRQRRGRTATRRQREDTREHHA